VTPLGVGGDPPPGEANWRRCGPTFARFRTTLHPEGEGGKCARKVAFALTSCRHHQPLYILVQPLDGADEKFYWALSPRLWWPGRK
jgi:hypothetical protein